MDLPSALAAAKSMLLLLCSSGAIQTRVPLTVLSVKLSAESTSFFKLSIVLVLVQTIFKKIELIVIF